MDRNIPRKVEKAKEMLELPETIIDGDGPSHLSIPRGEVFEFGLEISPIGIRDRIDMRDSIYASDSEDSDIEHPVEIIHEEMTETVNQEYEDIVFHGERVYRGSFGVIYLLSEKDWVRVFGTEPKGGLRWEPIWSGLENTAKADLESEEKGIDDRISSDEVERLSARLANADEKVLSIRCRRSDELVAMGILTEKQAQVYALRQAGYKIADIASILGTKSGTVSSHVNRAEREMAKMRVAVDLGSDFDSDFEFAVYHPERVGNQYITDAGRTALVIAYGFDGHVSERSYVVEYGDGSLEKVSEEIVGKWEADTIEPYTE
jgi:DNA-binding CsgD family transcriptional regulator